MLAEWVSRLQSSKGVMFLRWFLVSTLGSLASAMDRANNSLPREQAREMLVSDIIKAFPELKSLAASKDASADSEVSDLHSYVEIFLPKGKLKISPGELSATRQVIMRQVSRLMDSLLVRHGGLDRKQAVPFVADTIRILATLGKPISDDGAEGIASMCRHGRGGANTVKATINAIGQDWRKRWEESQAEAARRYVSLVQSEQGKDLMAKWKAATNYKSWKSVCQELVEAGTEGARVIVELGRDAEVRKEYSQNAMLSQCLDRIGEAAAPAIMEFLSLSEGTCVINLTESISQLILTGERAWTYIPKR